MQRKSTINFNEVHWQFQELFKLTFRQGITPAPVLFSCFPVAKARWRSSSLLWGKVFASSTFIPLWEGELFAIAVTTLILTTVTKKKRWNWTTLLSPISLQLSGCRLLSESFLREGLEPARLSNSPRTVPQTNDNGGTAPMSLTSRSLLF